MYLMRYLTKFRGRSGLPEYRLEEPFNPPPRMIVNGVKGCVVVIDPGMMTAGTRYRTGGKKIRKRLKFDGSTGITLCVPVPGGMSHDDAYVETKSNIYQAAPDYMTKGNTRFFWWDLEISDDYGASVSVRFRPREYGPRDVSSSHHGMIKTFGECHYIALNHEKNSPWANEELHRVAREFTDLAAGPVTSIVLDPYLAVVPENMQQFVDSIAEKPRQMGALNDFFVYEKVSGIPAGRVTKMLVTNRNDQMRAKYAAQIEFSPPVNAQTAWSYFSRELDLGFSDELFLKPMAKAAAG
jgi:hypothetical protein